eukprot:CAMPEP_0170525720 /NCGR_PEP_ID=MMETSP0209-20121228/11158_1 /TAXON_ID=665100 ORGANISM="Litonotus pictus, Strain P1" /NCGR_SAMPLE_ID=MMETSP0209 /ASSEMBLY_ACC=CAM_ASM_000301 /LENGTH=594 /DNA_ID=CAMNT_0010815109 /DNA_START=236 /DNA_END=2020 /DNA_ORIENTATION=-
MQPVINSNNINNQQFYSQGPQKVMQKESDQENKDNSNDYSHYDIHESVLEEELPETKSEMVGNLNLKDYYQYQLSNINKHHGHSNHNENSHHERTPQSKINNYNEYPQFQPQQPFQDKNTTNYSNQTNSDQGNVNGNKVDDSKQLEGNIYHNHNYNYNYYTNNNSYMVQTGNQQQAPQYLSDSNSLSGNSSGYNPSLYGQSQNSQYPQNQEYLNSENHYSYNQIGNNGYNSNMQYKEVQENYQLGSQGYSSYQTPLYQNLVNNSGLYPQPQYSYSQGNQGYLNPYTSPQMSQSSKSLQDNSSSVHSQVGLLNPISYQGNNQSYSSLNVGGFNNNYIADEGKLNNYKSSDSPKKQTNNQSFIALTNIKNISSFLSNYIYPSNPNNYLARYFVIKSIDEDNILKSIKFSVWSSTQKGNSKLNKIYKDCLGKYPIYLFFSINGSGKFLGVAQMVSEVDNNINYNNWVLTDKWKGFFKLHWLIIKDVPNKYFKNLSNNLNEGKCVVSSRDTQEIEKRSGDYMQQIIINYPYESSIVDDDKYDQDFFKHSTFIQSNYITMLKSNNNKVEKSSSNIMYNQEISKTNEKEGSEGKGNSELS